MKKLILITVLAGAMSIMTMAQDDDLYFSSKSKSNSSSYEYNSGSNRYVDEYNRMKSSYEVIGNDKSNTSGSEKSGDDVISFSGGQGVYPDSVVSDNRSEEHTSA